MKNNILFVILFHTTLCFAQGGGVGNGGDTSEFQFRNIGKQLVEFIRTNAEAKKRYPDLDLDKVTKAIRTTTVEFVRNRPKDKFGRERNAVNIAEQNLILVHRKSWRKTFKGDQRIFRYVLVLHEYLGIAGIEADEPGKDKYEMSGRLYDLKDELLRPNEAAVSEDLNDLDWQELRCYQLALSMAAQAQGQWIFSNEKNAEKINSSNKSDLNDLVKLTKKIYKNERPRILNEEEVQIAFEQNATSITYQVRVGDINQNWSDQYQIQLKRSSRYMNCYLEKMEKTESHHRQSVD